MVWFRVDDSLPDHPKMLAIQGHKSWKGALALWTLAGAWCGKHLTDGAVPRAVVLRLGGTPAEAAALVEHGFWDETPTGYIFHDWEARNPTRASVEAQREKTKQRVAKHDAKAKRETVANAEENAGANAVPNAVSNGGGNGPPVPSRPFPTDPAVAAEPPLTADFPETAPPDVLLWRSWERVVHNGMPAGSRNRTQVFDALHVLEAHGWGPNRFDDAVRLWVENRRSDTPPRFDYFARDIASLLTAATAPKRPEPPRNLIVAPDDYRPGGA